MIRWNFYFDEGSIQTDVCVEEEDIRLRNYAFDPDVKNIKINTAALEMWINMKMVKCITRQEISEESNAESKSEAVQ